MIESDLHTSKQKVSTNWFDVITMFIALSALAMAGFSTYMDFFNKKTSLEVIGVDPFILDETSDTLTAKINLIISNNGDFPVFIYEAVGFVSKKKCPDFFGSGSENGWGAYFPEHNYYTYPTIPLKQIKIPSKEIIIYTVDLNIDLENFKKVMTKSTNSINEDDLSKSYLVNAGVFLDIIDANGVEILKSICGVYIEIGMEVVDEKNKFCCFNSIGFSDGGKKTIELF